MEECVDGEYQNFKSKGGAYTREHFFGKYPELKEMVANMSDEEIWHLNRGGHDPQKVYAAYASAVANTGAPTVILAKTVKGFGMGKAGEGLNSAHQQKKLGDDALKEVRDRFNIPITDEEIAGLTFRKPDPDSEEMKYLQERRANLGGYLPARNSASPPLVVPPLEAFSSLLEGTGDREISTTMALVRMLTALVKDKNIGKHIVPIVPDEARTFGMEGMFRQIGIYSSVGQLYTPQDADQLMFYREDKQGQILEEGINEAGSLCSWLAAATAYSNHGVSMVPSTSITRCSAFSASAISFGRRATVRRAAFWWAAPPGARRSPAKGLQHQDGHSQLVATTVPNCVAYDPTYAYELAVIVQDGLRRMYQEQENVFYYITCMNENYAHPAMPAGAAQGILSGMYLLQTGGRGKVRVTLFGSGTILREVLAAAELLEKNYGVPADVYSVTSFSELRKNALAIERWNLLHPNEPPQQTYIQQVLADRAGPFIAATDYMKTVADQIRQWVPGRYAVLGTDGYGRSDSRAELRRFFEVDRHYVMIAALKALVDDGKIDKQTVSDAMKTFGIDPEKPNPLSV